MTYNKPMDVEETKMPYREKIAWLYLVAMAVPFIPYFALVEMNVLPQAALPDLRRLAMFAAACLVQVTIIGIGALFLFIKNPVEARTPLDERENAIMRRSMSYAYYVLITGMIIVGCVMPFTSAGWAIVNSAIFTIIVAELVHNAAIVYGYRVQA